MALSHQFFSNQLVIRAVNLGCKAQFPDIRIETQNVFDQQRQADFRRLLVHGAQGAFVEGLNGAQLIDTQRFEFGNNQACKFFHGRVADAVPFGLRFDLDIPADVFTATGRVRANSFDYFPQHRLVSLRFLLLRESCIAITAAIKALNFGSGHLINEQIFRFTGSNGIAAGFVTNSRIEPRFVTDNQLFIPGNRHIQFERSHFREIERMHERRNAVLRHQAPAAAVALPVETGRRLHRVFGPRVK